MRLFVAIDIPAGVEATIGALLNHLKPLAKLSWTTVDRLHITTKFIGEWPEDRLDEIEQALGSVDFRSPFEISIAGLNWFPNARNPRVLFASVNGGEALHALARATEDALYRLDIGGLNVALETGAYSPHLTLARIRDRARLDQLKRAIDALNSPDFGSFRAEAFALYLSRAGRYTRLAEFPLALLKS